MESLINGREMEKGYLERQESEIPNRIDLGHVLARALARNWKGWRFVAITLLTINAIWLVFGVLGYCLAAMIFR
jgi:hypothetical protein